MRSAAVGEPAPVFEVVPPIDRECRYAAQSGALRDQPGTWAVVVQAANPNAAQCHAQAIKTGRRKAFRPPGAFDAVARGSEVIACFVGD